MRSQIKWIFVLVVSVLLSPVYAHAVGSLPWSTTFNYGPCSQRGGGGQADCGITSPDGLYFDWGATAVGSNYTQVTSAANYPGGAGGNGARFWIGDGTNINTGTIRVDLPSTQKEVWVRWYARWQNGAKWNPLSYEKSVYFRSGTNTTFGAYAGFYGSEFRIYNEGSVGTYPIGSGGWYTAYPSGTSDGSWHCYEIHMKMDTNSSNGIGQIWVDGSLIISQTNVNWSNGNTTIRNGWDWFEFKSNQATPSNGGSIYVDYDDMAIYNTTPPNVDGQGNAFIGPIGGSVSTPLLVNGACGSASGQSFTSLTSASSNLCSTGTVSSFAGSGPWTWGCNGSGGGTSTSSTACTASLASAPAPAPAPAPAAGLLFSESFENNSYASRGWYDNTTFGTIVSGGQSGNAVQLSWAKGATTPTNGGSMRYAFTPTSSLYVSFYVKFATGWQGSQQTYHPHIFYIMSNLDYAANIYSPLANNYLTTYIEFLSQVGSPYAIHPQIQLQDELNVNTSYGVPPNNLTATTENRSVNYCNTPTYTGTTGGDCYADFTYYSANRWNVSSSTIATNAWHHIEAYFKMNSISGGKGQNDGIMQEWVDGTQILNQSNVLYRTGQHPTMTWQEFVIAPYIGSGAPIAETMLIDELTVGTSLPSGASVVAPTGLQIKSVTP